MSCLRPAMRLHFLVCFALLIFIVLIDADTPTQRSTFQGVSDIGNFGRKLLRSSTVVDKGNTEGRAGGVSVSGFDKFKSVFSSSKATPEKLHLASWLESGKSADTVFTRLHLHKGGNPFYKPQFSAWVQYAEDLGTKAPEMSAISTLTRQYGDELLFNMIETAKTNPRTELLATKLEIKQMQQWVRTRKDPDEVYQLLSLDGAWKNIFDKPEFTTWTKYVDDLNTKYPEEPTWMYSTLKKYFNDEMLFKMIYAVKWSENTKSIVTKFEKDWIQAGIQNHKTPYHVLLDLGLGNKADDIMEQLVSEKSLSSTWVKYMEVFNMRYPEEKTTMIETLTRSFGDITVIRMLHTAKMKAWTRNLATKLVFAQLKMWLDSGKSTDDVFKLLKFDKGENIYIFQDKLLLSTWVSYINKFIKKNPDEKDALFLALQARLQDRPLNQILNEAKAFPRMEIMAAKIQTTKIQNYYMREESPTEVFELLALDDIGDDILGTPLFQKWMKYVEDFNKQNPRRRESWFDPLRIEYQWGGIRMIDKAMQNPSTVRIGKKVEREWLNYWLDAGKPPEAVFRWLFLDAASPNLVKAGGRALADRKFKTWTTYLDEFSERYPTKAITVIDGLRANYNDINLLGVFKEAKNNPTTERLTINLENALIEKWVAEKKSVEFLQNQLGHVDTSKDMIQRYTARLEKLRDHTS